MAGLACARALLARGATVRLFDKGRGPGGRMATRRVDGPSVRFDHGAQYFTAREPAFRAEIDRLIAVGAVARWEAEIARISADGGVGVLRPEPRFVGMPGMNGVIKGLAEGLDVQWGAQVTTLHREGEWRLKLADSSEHGPFAAVVLAVPAEQAVALLRPHDEKLAAEAVGARTAPCWAGMFAYAAPVACPFDAVSFAEHPVLSFAALNSAKPGRDQNQVAWIAHATPAWSRAHLGLKPEEIAPQLLAALSSFFDQPPEPIFTAAHRWRYAMVETPVGTPYGWNETLRLGAVGDWRLGARVELAWRSGHELGAALT